MLLRSEKNSFYSVGVTNSLHNDEWKVFKYVNPSFQIPPSAQNFSTFYGREDKYFAQIFIVACEDVMKSSSVTANG